MNDREFAELANECWQTLATSAPGCEPGDLGQSEVQTEEVITRMASQLEAHGYSKETSRHIAEDAVWNMD